MANPNDAVGTNGAFGGRTSVNAFNDILSAFSGRGIVSGWSASPSSGLTINLGGNGNDRDVAIAEDAAGNKTTVNNISQAPVQVTINAAPASNSRIDAVVAYIEDSPSGSGVTDNPDVVNLLVVSGTVASSPTTPTDNAIRSAITADGASGSTAYYVVLATIRIQTGTTDIDSSMINQGNKALLSGAKITDKTVTANKIDFETFPSAKIVSFGATGGSIQAENDLVLLVFSTWSAVQVGDVSSRIVITGASGTVMCPESSQFDNNGAFTRMVQFGAAICRSGDRITISSTGTNSTVINYMCVQIPCNPGS